MNASTTLSPAPRAADDGPQNRSSSRLFIAWFPLALLAITLTATGLLTLNAKKDAELKARAAFERRTGELERSIAERMHTYEEILRGVMGLFLASKTVEPDAWKRYVSGLDLGSHFPGMLTIGYAELLSRDQLPGYLARMRRDAGPDFRIFPPGDRPAYAPVTLSGPSFVGKPAMIGFDLLVDPPRREAIERARRSTLPILSGKLALRDRQEHPGFLMLLPVVDATADRVPAADSPRGLIIGVFRMRDLMAGVIGRDLPDVDLQVYDGPLPAAAALLYEDNSIARDTEGASQPAFEALRTVTLLDRQWTIRFASLPYRTAVAELYKPIAIGVGGTLVSLLLFVMSFSLARMGDRAERLAARMTEAARANEAKFRSYVERAPLGVLVADAAGRILECNQAGSALLAPGAAASLRASVLELCEPDDRDLVRTALQQLSETGEMEAEWRLSGSDGRPRWLLWRAVRFPDGRFLAFCQDVTQRRLDADALRESEARALSASRMKSEFLASMSHELRTPLTSIRGFSELMERRSQVPAIKEQAAIIRRAAEHLTALLNDILDLSKVEAGAMQIVPKPVAIRKIATDTVELFRSAAEAKGLTLNFAVGADVPRAALWDSLRVKQVLNNLLSNAIKFTVRGWVRVDVNVVDQDVRFDVTDTGPGIAPESQAVVFERFRQADERVAHYYGGTGLGLALALSLAELMGGTLTLRSELGRGCCFTLSIPLGLGPEEAAVELSSTDGMPVHATASRVIFS